MKKILTLCLALAVFFIACKTEKNNKKEVVATEFVSFGEKISGENAISTEKMMEVYNNLNPNDTANVKFIGRVNSVCQKKGCWIKVPLENKKEVFVKFKDYAFFMPFNAAGSEVILNGKAFKNEISVKELQHYAKDAGKSEEEIAKITQPKSTYSFVANGVLLASKANEK